MSFKSELETII